MVPWGGGGGAGVSRKGLGTWMAGFSEMLGFSGGARQGSLWVAPGIQSLFRQAPPPRASLPNYGPLPPQAQVPRCHDTHSPGIQDSHIHTLTPWALRDT